MAHEGRISVVEVPARDVFVTAPRVHVMTESRQGPPGPDVSGALRKENRLSEYAADTDAQQAVQTNIGLGLIDPLAYYILAKA